MRDRIIGALDTRCRCGEMTKTQNRYVDWQHRWTKILKENSKTEFRVWPREDRRIRRHLPISVGTLLLLSHGIEPAARQRGHRRNERDALRKINLHWHDLRHEA